MFFETKSLSALSFEEALGFSRERRSGEVFVTISFLLAGILLFV
jgi:hypothetical protein